jgi:hypothetical protein
MDLNSYRWSPPIVRTRDSVRWTNSPEVRGECDECTKTYDLFLMLRQNKPGWLLCGDCRHHLRYGIMPDKSWRALSAPNGTNESEASANGHGGVADCPHTLGRIRHVYLRGLRDQQIYENLEADIKRD